MGVFASGSVGPDEVDDGALSAYGSSTDGSPAHGSSTDQQPGQLERSQRGQPHKQQAASQGTPSQPLTTAQPPFQQWLEARRGALLWWPLRPRPLTSPCRVLAGKLGDQVCRLRVRCRPTLSSEHLLAVCGGADGDGDGVPGGGEIRAGFEYGTLVA